MATGLADFLMQECPAFNPKPYYEKHTDSLLFYFEDKRSFGRRVNQYLTVFLAIDDRSLVGFEIKRIKTVFKAIQDLGFVSICNPVSLCGSDGNKFELSLLVKAACLDVEHDQTADIFAKSQGISVDSEMIENSLS